MSVLGCPNVGPIDNVVSDPVESSLGRFFVSITTCTARVVLCFNDYSREDQFRKVPADNWGDTELLER